MKKNPLVCTLAIAISGAFALPIAAEISIGGNAGYLYTMDNQQKLKNQNYTITQSGFNFSGEAAWKTAFETDTELLGEVSLITGVRVSKADIISCEPPNRDSSFIEVKISTVPLFAFVRGETGYVYADLGLGVHFWQSAYLTNVSDLGNKGTDFGMSFSAGPRIPVLERLVIRAGPVVNYYLMPKYNGTANLNSITLGATAGVSLEF